MKEPNILIPVTVVIQLITAYELERDFSLRERDNLKYYLEHATKQLKKFNRRTYQDS